MAQVYNRIVTEDNWSKVAKINKEAMEDYLTELKAQRKKDSTIKQYKNDVKIILVYILENCDNKPITELNRKDFRRFLLWLTDEKNLSNARCNRLMSSLRTFLEYLTDDDDYADYEVNPAAKVKGLPKEAVRDIVFIKDADILALYDYFIDMKKYREALAVGILYETGCRKGEALQISRNALRMNNGVTNTVTGKRGKKFKLTYFRLTRKAFALYESQREDDYDCLFLNRLGEPMDDSSFYNMVCNFVNYFAEVSDTDYTGLNVHSFRHSFIQNLKDGSHYICREILNTDALSLDKIQLLAHHSNVNTTQGYCKDESTSEIAVLFGLDMDALDI